MPEFMPLLTRNLKLSFDEDSAVNEFLAHVGNDLEELLEHLGSIAEMPYVAGFILEGSHAAQKASLPPLPRDIDPHGAMSLHGPRLVRSVALNLRAAVHKAVIQQYGSVDKENAAALYRPFFELLFDLFGEPARLGGGRWPGLCGSFLPIFTTNYDPAVEAFHEVNFDTYTLTDGFRYLGRERRESWNPEHFDRALHQRNKRNLALFKLHGSTDWITIGSRIRRAEPRYVADGEEEWSNCLVYPAKKKVSLEEPYFTCYDYLQQCLGHARVCVTIGYSFRDYDALTRVKSALLNNEELVLVVVSPNATELLGDLNLGPQRVRPINLPFGYGAAGELCLASLRSCLEPLVPPS